MAVAIGAANPAVAGSSSGTMAVSATVENSCTVAAQPMDFGGSLSTIGKANVDAMATLSLACTANTDYAVALDNGVNAASGQRRMRGAVRGEYLNYDVFVSNARTSRWGQTVGSDTVAGTTASGATMLTAYGRISSSSPAVASDAYTDTITVTVNF